jgi:hypothetical protein
LLHRAYEVDADSLEPLAQLISLKEVAFEFCDITSQHGIQPVVDLLASAKQGHRLKIKKMTGTELAEGDRRELIRARDALVAERGSRSVPVLDLED